MSDVAIQVEGLYKRYRIGAQKRRSDDTLGGAVIQLALAPFQNLKSLRKLSRFVEGDQDEEDVIWALRNVSCEIEEGESIGIIGRNGSGKSTLLKVISRITEPTRGYVRINGRVGSLLEVGTGFHPELTGRENIYLNGTVLGMTRREIQRKFDAIVDFAGVERFLDTPVKRYSTGMKVRLAFAVAAHMEPEILVVDEVLAVGDVEFQRKCLGKMEDVSKQGRTVLFVSHNLGAISSLCQRVIVLESGVVRQIGPAQEVVSSYLSHLSQNSQMDLRHRTDRRGSGRVRVVSMRIEDEWGREVQHVMSGQTLRIVLGYEAQETVPQAMFGVGFYNMLGVPIFVCDTRFTGLTLRDVSGAGEIVCHIPRLALPPGTYHLNVDVTEGKGKPADCIEGAMTLEVVDGDFYGTGRSPRASAAVALLEHSWYTAGGSAVLNGKAALDQHLPSNMLGHRPTGAE